MLLNGASAPEGKAERTTNPSREAAAECSPGRKPWVSRKTGTKSRGDARKTARAERATRPLFLTLQVWNGHSCPLPLTLILSLTLIVISLCRRDGRNKPGRARRSVVPKAETSVEERRFSAA